MFIGNYCRVCKYFPILYYSISSRFESSPQKSILSVCNYIKREMSTFERLKFDNKSIRRLPIDKEERNYVRTVNGACFSRVTPAPLKNPQLVSHSSSALQLIDLDDDDVKRPEFVDYFCGNKLMVGSETYSHCYCGHQFGVFAGQLGDGAAIYLGEIVNAKGERWELQLKGAGQTPYSRDADGRKVLRSSIREYLCSEAMHHLGIPTTRAGTCITSDDRVIRDIFYDGHPKHERCTVISRIAESFIRFGSFEIFKTMDPESGRRGPSVGMKEILKDMIDYVIETLYPEIHESNDETIEKYKKFYSEVVRRTAKLVALWQCVGFCHGVLNTDNMSIFGLTIDYGPFGFMDRYDPDHVCNTSDDSGRYSYISQPKICQWNCFKLAEALSPFLPLQESKPILEAVYFPEFESVYFDKMRKKMGFCNEMKENDGDVLSDSEIIKTFLETLEHTGGDFTNCFRSLNILSLRGLPHYDESVTQLKAALMSQCSTINELIEANETSMGSRELSVFLMLLQSNPQLLSQMVRGPKTIERIVSKLQRNEKLKEITPEEKLAHDDELWTEWINKYSKRLNHEYSKYANDTKELEKQNKQRIETMNLNNPKYVLRNHFAQQAIDKAENGDFSEVSRVLKLLENPYVDSSESLGSDASEMSYDSKPPNWACKLKVSCSS